MPTLGWGTAHVGDVLGILVSKDEATTVMAEVPPTRQVSLLPRAMASSPLYLTPYSLKLHFPGKDTHPTRKRVLANRTGLGVYLLQGPFSPR